MFFAILMFGEPGTEILYPNPGFPIYEIVIRFSGATPVPIRSTKAPGSRSTPTRCCGDHAEDAADHRQQPGQPDRRRRAAGELDRLVAGLEQHPMSRC